MATTADTVTITSDTLSAEIAMLGAEMQRLTTNEGRQLQWDGDPAVWPGVAELVIFLLSPAADYITGTTVTIDGAFSLTVAQGA